MSQLKYLSVSEFNLIISNIIRAEEMLYNVTLLGEVSQFKAYGNHSYFTLKDKDSEISCTCFNYNKTYVPKQGESILATGSPNFYAKKGTISFNIERIKPAGIGELYVKLEELKIKLKQEGLFDDKFKVPIPQFPKNICVVTSLNGAVIRDIVTTIRLRNDIINIKVYDVRVQGEGAAKTIIKALKDVDKCNYDVIILARGGGSLEDLMPFNDEELARTIFALNTPIISAVGHETDFSISDFVADKRAATPTAAAEMIAYNVKEWKQLIISKSENMYNNIINNYKRMRLRVNNGINLINTQSMLILNRNYNKTDKLMKSMCEMVGSIYISKEHKLDKLISALDLSSPIKLLRSGYFRVSKDRLPIYSVKQLKQNDNIIIRGADGEVNAKVLDIKEIKE